jgi:alpha-glucosidase/oligosaccharide 4-alpha-D-glucosyltransferase
MLPYNYTIAFDNSQTGMPLMRPVLFEEPDGNTQAISSTYLWGPDFLVAPVVEPGAARKEVYFPVRDSLWFDFYSGQPHRGGITEVVATAPDHIPVFVRAGAFIALAKVVQSTRDYSTRQIDLHYYHDPSVTSASGKLYDDDGVTALAYEQGKYEIVRFSGKTGAGRLEIGIQAEPGKNFTPVQRAFALKVHNIAVKPRSVAIGGRGVPFTWNAQRKVLEVAIPPQRQAATVAIAL